MGHDNGDQILGQRAGVAPVLAEAEYGVWLGHAGGPGIHVLPQVRQELVGILKNTHTFLFLQCSFVFQW